MAWTFDLLDEHNWHTTLYFGHYFLTILFSILAVLFAFRFWEISDYSNREEVKAWLERYIADGWWRKGGLNVWTSTTRVLLVVVLLFLVVHSIANNFTDGSLSNGLVVTTLLAIVAVLTIVIWFIGFLAIRSTEASFVRYVSQNVAYTSAIILKRAIKAKFDLGLILMCAMFVPLVYTLLQSLLCKFVAKLVRILSPSPHSIAH
jgi:hypothetical protein